MGEIKAGVTLMQDFCRPRTEKFQEYIDYMDREEAQRNNLKGKIKKIDF